jgi:transposase
MKPKANTNEVSPHKPTRRIFSADDKLRILAAADTCSDGDLAALLRTEGLYSSQLQEWRAIRDQAQRDAFAPKKQGRKPTHSSNDLALQQLRRQNTQLLARAERAEAIVDLQKKISALLVQTEEKNSSSK